MPKENRRRHGPTDLNELQHDLQRLDRDGFLVKHGVCDSDTVRALSQTAKTRSADIRRALGDRPIGIGSRAGFVEIVQRSPGRWDVPISPAEFNFDDRSAPWWPLVSSVLGADAEHSFSGVVSSEAGTPAQHWHTDSPHESERHLAPHAINVLLALHDIPLQMGPTECAGGSHRLTNHLSNKKLVIDELIYQHQSTCPESLVAGLDEPVPIAYAEDMPAGSWLIFDDRLLHRGMANAAAETRHVAYFSYRRSDYDVNTHFESQRSVYDAI